MKKLIASLMVTVFCVGMLSPGYAAEKPKALEGVDLSTAEPLSDLEAQEIKGALSLKQFKNYVKDRLKNSGDWRSALLGPLSIVYRFLPDKS